MSSLSQKNQTLRSLILQVFFQNQRLHQPRERHQHQRQDLQTMVILKGSFTNWFRGNVGTHSKTNEIVLFEEHC